MFFKRDKPGPRFVIRQAKPSDWSAIQRLINEEEAVYSRLFMDELRPRLNTEISYVVENRAGLRAFLLVEAQSAAVGVVMVAAFHNYARLPEMLEVMLPKIERDMRARHLTGLMQTGDAPWLNRELPRLGFRVREQVITLEWLSQRLPKPQANPALQVRSVRLEDIPNLLVLDNLAFDEMWRKPRLSFREALDRAASFSVAHLNGELVGYQWMDRFEKHAHLTRLATHPAYRRQGIASHLLYQGMSEVLAMKVRTITLNTQVSNVSSQRLYKRFGFVETAQVVDVYWKDLGEAT